MGSTKYIMSMGELTRKIILYVSGRTVKMYIFL